MTIEVARRVGHTDLSAYFPVNVTNPLAKDEDVAIFMDSGSINHNDFIEELAVALGAPILPTYVRVKLKYAYPRGIKWHDFPIISEPWYKAEYVADVVETWGKNRLVKMQPSWVVDQKLAVMVSNLEPANRAKLIHDIAYFLIAAGCGDAVVWHDINGSVESNTATELWDLNKAHFRFLYSYALNFRVLGLKALKASGLAKPSYANSQTEKYEGISVWTPDEGMPSSLLNPFVLQMLYKLRKDKTIWRNTNTSGHLELRDLLEPSGDAWAWKGTGKYPELNSEAYLMGRFDKHRNAILRLKFATPIDDSFAELSEIGHRFLNILHKDNEDPDIMIRWLNPETGVVDEKHSDAVDDWLMRFFCKMKTQVNKV